MAETFLFLPFITCLFWLILNPFLHSSDGRLKTFQLLLSITGLAALALAFIKMDSNGNTILICNFARQFLTPMIIPAAYIYLRKIEGSSSHGIIPLAGIATPVSLLFAQIILYLLSGTEAFNSYLDDDTAQIVAGTEKVEQLTRLCSIWIFYGILVSEALLFCLFIISRVRKKRVSIQHFNLLAFMIIYLMSDISLNILHPDNDLVTVLAAIILSAILFMTSYASLFHNKPDLNLRDLLKGTGQLVQETDNMEKIRTALISQGISPDTVHLPKDSRRITADARQSQMDEESLKIRFEDLIVTEQLFLRQGIRVSDIASMLETNRTYISRLVNNTYNMSFSDYINTLRIDYAKQYLLHDRNAKQSDIAAACGFPNASAFNNVFKKITGVTPKIWLITNS